MTEIRPNKLDEAKLKEHDFYPEDFEEFTAFDEPVHKHHGYTIALCIPNGGILGVSFYKASTDECYSRPTEGCDDFPGYGDEQAHINMAIAAIDAAMPEPVADQLELV